MTVSLSALRDRRLHRVLVYSLTLSLSVVFVLTFPLTRTSSGTNPPPPPPSGIITQLAPPNGCINSDGDGGLCGIGTLSLGVGMIAVSPDGLNVYATSFRQHGLMAFSRDPVTSALTQIACYSKDGANGCTLVNPLAQAYGVAVSPDGKFVYVSSQGGDAVVVMARDKKTGLLTKTSCVGRSSNGGCTKVFPLNHPQGLAISKDGRVLVVASRVDDALIAFARNKSTGALTKLNCVSNKDVEGGNCAVGVGMDDMRDVAISPDSKSAYGVSHKSNAISAFSLDKKKGLTQLSGTDACVSQDGTGGACAIGGGLGQPIRVDVSSDGKNVYVASQGPGASAAGSDGGAVAIFSRAKKGALTFLGCISNDGSGGCTQGVGLAGASGVLVSPDGFTVYLGAWISSAVSVFARDATTGLLTQLASPNGCVSQDGTGGQCATGIELDGAQEVVVSPDNTSVYVTAGDKTDIGISTTSNAITIFSRQ